MAMGTRFECVLGPEAAAGAAARDLRAIGELALEEIEECHRRFSRFAPDSLVSHVARTPAREAIRLDEPTWELFRDALQVGRDSGGAFDITVGAAMATRGFAQSAVMPSGGPNGQDAITLDQAARAISLARPGVVIDLGGIAKGHALDCAAACLRAHGVTSAFVHGGTSSGIAIGRPARTEAWTVAVGTAGGTTLRLVNRAFSVSEPLSQRGRGGHGHILDPRRRRGGNAAHRAFELDRAIVTGPSARLADAWSTALVVIGAVPPAFPAGYAAHLEPAARGRTRGQSATAERSMY